MSKSPQAKCAKLPDTHRESISVLQKVSLFEDLKDNMAALQAYAEILELRHYSKGAEILSEGLASAEMFILILGSVSVYKKTPEGDMFKVAVLTSHDHQFFGEGGLIGSELRTATLKADSDCSCLVLKSNSFQEFAKQFPQWALPSTMGLTTISLYCSFSLIALTKDKRRLTFAISCTCG